MRWRKVTLIGVGLLGGSLGLALRKRSLAAEVCGFVRREGSIAECLQAGAVDRATIDLAEAVAGADLIVLCTPLFQMTELALGMQAQVQSEALVTDVGSVKAALVAELEPVFAARGASFVGSHPMAGSEKTGVSAARADLFLNAACAVTPTAKSPQAKVEETEALWRAVGGRILRLSPEMHDELVSRSSHLPHVLAAQLAAYVLEPGLAPSSRGSARPVFAIPRALLPVHLRCGVTS
jgi:prephenate dehydrogenase